MSAFAGQDLARRNSLTALLFRLEQRQSREDLVKLVGEVGGWFSKHPDFEPLQRPFHELILQSIAYFGVQTPIPHNFGEIKTMLATLPDFWLAEAEAKGEIKGRAIGKAEAKAEAKVENLIDLLTTKFGPLRPDLNGQIQAADPTTIDSWFRRAIFSSDVSSVFAAVVPLPAHHSRSNRA